MTSHFSSSSDANDPIVAAVDHYLARYGWRLATREALIVLARVAWYGGAAATPERVVVYTYTLLRYRCCRGEEGTLRRDLAFAELADDLYAVAVRRDPLHAEEAVQAALYQIFDKLDRCREPGAFFAFCLQHLRSASHRERQTGGQNLPWREDEVSDTPNTWSVSSGSAVLDHVMRDDFAHRVQALLQAYRDRYPRSKMQLKALVLECMEGLTISEIADRLDRRPDQIHVLRSLARRRLAADPQWQALAVELGLLDPRDEDES